MSNTATELNPVLFIPSTGDLVFGKVKGYPPWPAKITSKNKSKFNVCFYGTFEVNY